MSTALFTLGNILILLGSGLIHPGLLLVLAGAECVLLSYVLWEDK